MLILDRRKRALDKAERETCSAFNLVGLAVQKAFRFVAIARRRFWRNPETQAVFGRWETKITRSEPAAQGAEVEVLRPDRLQDNVPTTMRNLEKPKLDPITVGTTGSGMENTVRALGMMKIEFELFFFLMTGILLLWN